MSPFSLSLCLSLIHSLWQSPILVIVYIFCSGVFRRQNPLLKRNISFSLLFTQLLISIYTFFTIYHKTYSSSFFDFERVSILFPPRELLEKLSPYLVSLYTAVLSLKFFDLLYKWQSLRSLNKQLSVEPPAGLRLFVLQKSLQLGIRKKVILWLNETVSVPMTFGFFKPVILMPVALLNQLSLAETEALLLHELAHIRNNDYLLNLFLLAIENLFFFNPFIKIIADKARLEREKNCDVQVLNFQYPAISYAEALLKAARLNTITNLFSLGAVLKKSQLRKRICYFTNNNLDFKKHNYFAFLFLLPGLILLLNIFVFKPRMSSVSVQKIKLSGPVSSDVVKNDNIADMFTTNVLKTESGIMPTEIPALHKIVHQTVTKTLKIKNTEKDITDNYTTKLTPVTPAINLMLPAADVEKIEKEITVSEEISGTGEKVSRLYRFKWEKDHWEKELLLTIRQGKPLDHRAADSLSNYFPPTQ